MLGRGGGLLRLELHLPCASPIFVLCLTLTLLTWTVWRAPTNASKWRMGFNSAFKGLNRIGLDRGALCAEVRGTCYK